MPRQLLRCGAVLALAVAIAGCAGGPPHPPQHVEEEWHAPVQILLPYADKDGKVTRAALEAGLRRDFDAADTNHDGVLEPDEVRAVNQQRWQEDKSSASPLIDWKGNGLIDFDEFAATARSLFDEFDKNHDGVLTPNELRPQAVGPQREDQQDEGKQGGQRRRGRCGGGSSGDEGQGGDEFGR